MNKTTLLCVALRHVTVLILFWFCTELHLSVKQKYKK